MKGGLSGILLTLCGIIMCSCDGLQTKVHGTFYEVLLVGNDSACTRIVRQEMERPVPGFPQAEPHFDVKTSPSLNEENRRHRNIVIVEKNAQETEPRVTVGNDKYAKGQLIVRLSVASADMLGQIDFQRMRETMDQSEQARIAQWLAGQGNPKAEKQAEEDFGVIISIPASLKSSKRAKDFLWFSNDAAEGMMNLCLYSYPATVDNPDSIYWEVDTTLIGNKRDSVMKQNIKGERAGTYMQTTSAHHARYPGGHFMTWGLWEMHGDMMGGPFVSHSIRTGNRIIVAEGFVYAPEGKKRNRLRILEAAVRTLQEASQDKKQ